MEQEQNQKKIRFSKVVVGLCLIVILIYTVWCARNYSLTGQEPQYLTTFVFTFFGMELGLLSFQKITEIKQEKKDFPLNLPSLNITEEEKEIMGGSEK